MGARSGEHVRTGDFRHEKPVLTCSPAAPSCRGMTTPPSAPAQVVLRVSCPPSARLATSSSRAPSQAEQVPKTTVEEWIRAQNGVAHTSALRLAGFSEHSVRRAIREGGLRRVRRSWVVTADCDPRRVAAASVGGRLICVSAASARGWWDVTADSVHVALPHSASRFDASGIRVHRARGPVPVHPRAVEEPHSTCSSTWPDACRRSTR